jgi:hypothetical protein
VVKEILVFVFELFIVEYFPWILCSSTSESVRSKDIRSNELLASLPIYLKSSIKKSLKLNDNRLQIHRRQTGFLKRSAIRNPEREIIS